MVRTIDSTAVNLALDRLGRLLQYPDDDLPVAVREARALIGSIVPAADEELAAFELFVKDHNRDDWRQIYTDAFDLDPLFKIYIGYHLFGETYKRSHFLVKLNEHYADHGYDCAPELPDHLATVLRFLPSCDHETFREGLIMEGIVPSIKQMLGKSPASGPQENSAARPSKPQSLQDAIRAAQSAFYRPDDIQASWHPEAFGQGVATKGLQSADNVDGLPPNLYPTEDDEFDRSACGPCPLAGGSMADDLGMQLKGVPEHEKERDMRKEEVRKGEEERQSHPYAHVLRALERVVDTLRTPAVP
ncbi:Nitrate reductase delta subunit [Candidatus Methylomirabilis lanthanidiphila]|uniref:Nitrate reductase delta subunit n=1 Tax=Candidatus Methylomirabilis lanthanidiphila TaxID=2211376 RepID=A0A564ZKX7_9BACT|nr:molecular chaperone TorD family protein [Candidatus Methylomirabilis lanthanidiphila]VUZ85990.1 Nitrate reductase delta subunit [Candidatus Methylomirabilis lanthanidiphila]